MTDAESTDDNSPDRASPDQTTTDQTTGSAGESDADESSPGHRKTVKYAIGFLFVMFGFGWGSIPLYRMVCKSLDPGGSSASATTADEYDDVEVDESRSVEVRFTANVQDDLPWSFRPLQNSVTVHPGEKKLVKFHSANLDQNREITGKAVYDINPPEAGQYFKKIECFCFKEQTLASGQKRKMPLYFWFESDLPDHVDKVTLGYTFFNAETSRERAEHTKR